MDIHHLLFVSNTKLFRFSINDHILAWVLQLAVYLLTLTLMKLTVVASLALFPFIFKISDFLLSEMSPNVQVVVSMCIWPLIMNVVQVGDNVFC